MLFNSLTFWIFLPVFLGAYFLTKKNARLWVCLAGSYLFYGWWDWRFLGLITLLTGLNYWCGLKIADSTEGSGWRKHYVRFSVVCSLVILGFFKYFNFFIDSFSTASASLGVGFNLGTMSIILPVGISFYTFQTMSYTIDLYRKEVDVERSLLKFSVFVSFFPQLVAGPIVRARDFLPQLQSDRIVEWENLRRGINLMLWGFVLKVLMADNLAVTVDRAFQDPTAVSGLYLLIGVVFYAFQIYGDFAGYSLIAIGLARVMGFRFNVNFNRPYLATSFSDFWQRWHISLSSWLRDYLYIPLGGNRKGATRTKINLMLTMLLGGLWHGAAWTFVAWGALHGAYLILQRVVSTQVAGFLPNSLCRFIGWLSVFGGVLLAWVFFRAQGFGEAFLVIEKIITFDRFELGTILRRLFFLKGLLLIVFVFGVEWLSSRFDFDELARKHTSVNSLFIVSVLLLLSFWGMFGGGAFIYFQF
jgi:D-alanyl-lipoteichoic acid acyltransferase DltB (MBOAT superfamily)